MINFIVKVILSIVTVLLDIIVSIVHLLLAVLLWENRWTDMPDWVHIKMLWSENNKTKKE